MSPRVGVVDLRQLGMHSLLDWRALLLTHSKVGLDFHKRQTKNSICNDGAAQLLSSHPLRGHYWA